MAAIDLLKRRITRGIMAHLDIFLGILAIKANEKGKFELTKNQYLFALTAYLILGQVARYKGSEPLVDLIDSALKSQSKVTRIEAISHTASAQVFMAKLGHLLDKKLKELGEE